MTMIGVEHSGRSKRKRLSSVNGVTQLVHQMRQQQRANINKTQFTVNTRRPSLSRPQVDHRFTYDWIIQTEGVHYACNRSTFSEYTSLNFPLSNGEWCQGIGIVNLDVQAPDHVLPIVLDHVLHLARAPCNGISIPVIQQQYPISFSPVDGGCRDPDGNLVWLSEHFHGFYRLVVPGEARRSSSLDETLKSGARPTNNSLSICLSDQDIAQIHDLVRIREALNTITF